MSARSKSESAIISAGSPENNDVPFDVSMPDQQTTPVVFASPHSGCNYPVSFAAASQLDSVALRRSEDAFVDQLYERAPQYGAPFLRAHFPRAYVDPNREPWELDPGMFSDDLPDWVNTSSPRVRAGLGTVAKVVTDGAEIYKGTLVFKEAEQRIKTCYKPYHAALKSLLDDTHAQFGSYLLIDCHSMPSIGGPMDFDSGNNRVDMVLGDVHGTSCAAEITAFVQTTLENMGYNVVLNTPYAGGFTTRNYGQGSGSGHALQIEVNRALYMDEQHITRTAGFSTLAKNLNTLMDALCTLDMKILKGKAMKAEIKIRNAHARDAPDIQNIYAHYVRNSVASFEEEAPDVDEILARRTAILDFGAPYIIAEIEGKVCGFAYASKFRPRSAYRHTVEDSIYIDPLVIGKGVGKCLLTALIERCTDLGFRQMVAVIGGTGNEASINLHRRLGFEQEAVLKSVGFKFGTWVDTVIMQRALGQGDTTLPK